MKRHISWVISLALCCGRAGVGPVITIMLILLLPATGASGKSLTIYEDDLASGWSNWSWGSTIAFDNADPVEQGVASIAVTYNTAWAGLYLHTDLAVSTCGYDSISFWIHGSGPGPSIRWVW